MRVSRLTISISLIIASFGLGLPRVAAAETLYSPPQQFVVHGVVPERREIVLDAAGNISQIFSNTDNTVVPTVTSGSLAGSIVPLTPQLFAQYTNLMNQLAANHIVTMTYDNSRLPVTYPDFTKPSVSRSYKVTPSKVGSDQTAAVYYVELGQN